MIPDSFSWPVPLESNHYVLGYRIEHSESAIIQPAELIENLARINREVRHLVWTGWSMFYPFTPKEIAPKVVPENSDGSGTYLLETNLANGRALETTLPDFWRISPKGWATLVRAYREDRARTFKRNADSERLPGTWLSPETPIRETAELVRHAYLFSQLFPSAAKVAFSCTWKGLRGRELKDFDSAIYWSPGRISHADVRKTQGAWAAADLLSDWQSVVAALSCPVLEGFGFDFCSAEFVNGMERRFRKLPLSVD